MKDPTSKTPRSFQCRDLLWMRFEQMAQELNCSLDYLINDAMKSYARQRRQSAAMPQLGSVSAPLPPAAIPPAPMRHTAPPPPPPGRATHVMPQPASPIPPVPLTQTTARPQARRTGSLVVSYGGQNFPVAKDRFVIGRGRQTSDLTIKDPNVSRRHAMVEFQNGNYFIVDMGSTNGVIHHGQRIQRKLIEDGDSVKVCDHDLMFSFH